MQVSAIPAKFPIPFGNSAGGSFIRPIPVASQIGSNPGFASLTDGFVPLNMTPQDAGGIPPFGQDMNGILFETTSWSQWQQAGGPVVYDATFQGQIGGYPKGAVIQSGIVPGKQWLSQVDNNTSNPDTLGANWSQPVGVAPAGTPVPSFSSTVLPGCVLANGLSIGNAASNATGLASATVFFLFCAIWLEFPQSTCPVMNNGVVTARGANPSADFAANRQIQTPLMQGSALVGADTMGGTVTTRLAGVPVVSGSVTSPGSFVGENLHVLVNTEIPRITGTVSASFSTGADEVVIASSITTVAFNNGTNAALAALSPGGFGLIGTTAPTSTGTFASTNTGAGGTGPNPAAGHNNVDLSYVVYWNLAL